MMLRMLQNAQYEGHQRQLVIIVYTFFERKKGVDVNEVLD